MPVFKIEQAISLEIEDFIDAGIEVLNPLQPECNAKDFGERLTFCGSVCVQTTLAFGNPDDVKREVERRKKLFSQGGLFLVPTHAIQVGTFIENIITLYKSAGSLTDTIYETILSMSIKDDKKAQEINMSKLF